VCRQLGLSEEGKLKLTELFMIFSISITKPGAEAINRHSIPDWYGPSTLSFFALDDVGCNGAESNLLHCLPQHNCGFHVHDPENAGVQCLRKGKLYILCMLHNNTYIMACCVKKESN
jgi:hypothetical protein